MKQTVVGWNFNNKTAKASSGIPANLNQNITREPGYAGLFDYSVVGVSGVNTDWSLSTTNWDNGANSKYWIVSFTTTGYYNLKLSSVQRSNGYGPKDFTVQYRVGNASAWTDLVPVKDSTDWIKGAISSIALPAVCENQPLIQVRWLSASNITPVDIPIQSIGSGRIDEISIVGDNTAPILGLIQKTNIKTSTSVLLYPNPTYSEINLDVHFKTPTHVYAKLLDLSGRILKEFTSSESVSQHIISFDLSPLTEGIYFIQVESPEERFVQNFVKMK